MSIRAPQDQDTDKDKQYLNWLEGQFGKDNSPGKTDGENSANSSLEDKEADSVNKNFYNPRQKSNSLKSKSAGKSRAVKLGKALLKKKSGASLAAAGLLIGVFSAFSAILPLQLTAKLAGLNDAFKDPAAHAMEQRFNHIATRWIAQRVLKIANPGVDDIVFCRGGGVICSLTSTKYSKWFEKKLDAKFEKLGRKVKVTLNSTGRSGLGGKAKSFEIGLEGVGDNVDNKLIGKVKKEIGHKEARKMVRKMVAEVHGKNFLMRHLSKRVIYNKYGITSFNIIPEKWNGKYLDFKTKLKTKLYTKTIGKLSPRIAAALSCINGGDALGCKETMDKLNDDLDQKIQDREKEFDNATGDSKNNAKARLEGAKKQKELLSGIGDQIDGKADGAIGKIIGKKIVQKALIGGNVLGAIDLLSRIVKAIDNKVIEVAAAGIIAQTYMSYAFDSDISPILIDEKMRAGDFTADDTKYMQLAVESLSGSEESLLSSAVNGTLPGSTASLPSLFSKTAKAAPGNNKGYKTKCNAGDGTEEVVELPAGEILCGNAKVVRNYTGFTDAKWFQVVSSIADFWVNTAGVLFKAVGDLLDNVTGWIMDNIITKIPGISHLTEWINSNMESIIQKGISAALHVPNTGIGASGKENYEAAGGALSLIKSMLGEEGQNDSGPTTGVGGAVLSDQQLASISEEIEKEQIEDFNDKPLLAKLFDPALSRSATSKILARMPSTGVSAFSMFLSTPATILSSLNPSKASAATRNMMIMKAYGQPWYGYANKSELEEDPSKYDEEFCKKSAKERADSFKLVDDEVIPVFTKTDPCALDKATAAMLANAVGDNESPHAIKEIEEESGGTTTISTSSSSDAIGEPEFDGYPENFEGWGNHKNGKIPSSELSPISFSSSQLIHKKAAVALEAMNEAYKKDSGVNLVINEAYRDCQTQINYDTPGHPDYQGGRGYPARSLGCGSNHGWALAVDINTGDFSSPIYKWLANNAHKYGFVNPPWARTGSWRGIKEPWHWEYCRKVD